MKTNFLIILLVFTIGTVSAQKKLADKFFSNYGYVKATELYKKAFDDGDESEHVLTRLGDCYYNNSNSEKAAYWYSKAVNKFDIDTEHLYRYIQSLKSIGNYTEADVWTKKFIENQNNDSRVRDYDSDNLSEYKDLNAVNESLSISIENLPINSEFSDFGSFIYDNRLYFASSRGLDKTKKYGWNKEPFLDLFQVSFEEKDSKLEFGISNLISASEINSDYHEATVAISNDGKTMYFTRDNVTRKNKLNFDKKGTTHLKIYKATLIDGNWENIKELSINDEVYSTGHPALSPDNKKLFFVSDRKGGIGQTDIYEVDILENNKFSTPKNLGSKVNTEGREMFPFISKDSILYFSSDGRLNLGLLDIFKSDFIKDSIAEPENLGAPFNSGYDDFAFFGMSDKENLTGYFSSNRPGGKGNDDIYSFNAFECSQMITGIAMDSISNLVLADVSIKLINKAGKVINQVKSNENGEYYFEVNCNQQYTVLAEKPDYKKYHKDILTNLEKEKVNDHNIYLQSLIIGNQILINPIFFDYDKWNIRTDAEYELENVVDILRLKPDMVIKIESHTDSRGKDSYNLKLSNRRAKSTRDYIISRGINAERIESSIGFGESQLLNKCTNGVKCTPEEHQINRRSYFYIVK
ncbi:MAG: OmpA family protein [Algibacter sp.]|uniref:OmpA family protein n=1 Tax=Algibacter sp. TaxID=1872428 RepID=UPI002636EEE0|nr:OmpA family protein [Algibacter sp.]MDG1728666.1 OmpA family protein [Algibacter sp.]MDG2177310.1 OmpA family protein [Algibacter sp.]